MPETIKTLGSEVTSRAEAQALVIKHIRTTAEKLEIYGEEQPDFRAAAGELRDAAQLLHRIDRIFPKEAETVSGGEEAGG